MKRTKKGQKRPKKSVNNYQRRKSIAELEKQYVNKSAAAVVASTATETKVEEKKVTIKKNVIATFSNEAVATVLSTSFKLEEIKETAVKVGLCFDRHEMNVDRFIYGTLTEAEMFNYPQLYNKAVAFINENCPNKILHLYCTGIQCALAAVIKAAHDTKCTLSLFHYNASTSTYMRQDMWKYTETFIDEISAAYSDIMRRGPVYTFGHIANQNELYTISVNQVRDDSDGFVNQAYVICDSLENAFKLYADYVKNINQGDPERRTRKAIFLTKTKVEKGRFIWDTNLSKSYNYK